MSNIYIQEPPTNGKVRLAGGRGRGGQARPSGGGELYCGVGEGAARAVGAGGCLLREVCAPRGGGGGGSAGVETLCVP